MVAGRPFRRLPEPEESSGAATTGPRQLLIGTGTKGDAGDAALCVLRVFAGVAFVMHGWGKVADVGGFSAASGVPVVPGAAAAYFRIIGGTRLAVGLLGWESAALYVVLMACFVILGGARCSLDHTILKQSWWTEQARC